MSRRVGFADRVLRVALLVMLGMDTASAACSLDKGQWRTGVASIFGAVLMAALYDWNVVRAGSQGESE